MTPDFPGGEELRLAWKAGLTPEPSLTVSAWADRHRVLGTRGSAEPGRWRTDRTPYLRDIMDALSPSSPYRRVVFQKGAQVGGTECGNNWIGFVIHHTPGPMLAVQPTTELAKRFSDQRIDPLLEETTALRERVAPARSRDSGNRQLSKEFPGGHLVMTGANSAVGLRSMSARFLFLDEVDAYPGDVDEEGDPIALAEARARTFGHQRKVFLVSTPTIEGASRIEREYEASDKRRYFVPCPHCGSMQWLKFERLTWTKGAPETVVYRCEDCDEAIEEHHKTAMLAAGEWQATSASADPHTIGFHISALYSPLGWMSWEQIARDWEGAQKKAEDIKTFRNTILGETFKERGDAPDWQRLFERTEPLRLGVAPRGALILTAGTDVQDDRIETTVWGWAAGYSSWVVDHVVTPGSPRLAETWDAWYAAIVRDWPREGGGRMRVAKICVDTGGRDTTEVYGHLRRLRNPAIAATKGIEGWNRATPVNGPTMVDARENGRKLRRGLRLWSVATATLKADLYRRLWLARADDTFPIGWVHIPSGIEPEWIRQLVSEELRTTKDRRGFQRQEWAKLRDRNEALDCAVLARAALWLAGADRYGDAFWQRQAADLADAGGQAEPPVDETDETEGEAPPAAPPPEKPKIAFRERGWLRRRH